MIGQPGNQFPITLHGDVTQSARREQILGVVEQYLGVFCLVDVIQVHVQIHLLDTKLLVETTELSSYR